MIIDLSELYSGVKEKIDIDSEVIFNHNLLTNSGILKLYDTNIKGYIYKDSSNSIILNANIKGNMLLEDSISLDDILYPFDINITENLEENLENNENTIDLVPILWQNIVLEVPLKYTKVKDFSKYSGDGWKLISEEEIGVNNPFLELKDKMKEE